jgi:hypothetical protein
VQRRYCRSNAHEQNEMRETEVGKFELVQAFHARVPSPHGNNTSGMDNNDSTTDGNMSRLPSSCRPQRDNFSIDNNRYSSIANRQQDDDTVDNNFGSNSEIEPTETAAVIPVTWATMIYVFCAALNSCNLGYDIGVSTNVSKLIQNDIHITDAQREIWIGFINLWASKWRCIL